jgi:NAD(P)-dependent dehydrogenase (short-subunit alcohol dehydrogenase family)
MSEDSALLEGKVALVAGATRGAGRGIAVQLGVAGATVYVNGRTTRSERSEMNQPETIEETAALVDEAGAELVDIQALLGHVNLAATPAILSSLT